MIGSFDSVVLNPLVVSSVIAGIFLLLSVVLTWMLNKSTKEKQTLKREVHFLRRRNPSGNQAFQDFENESGN